MHGGSSSQSVSFSYPVSTCYIVYPPCWFFEFRYSFPDFTSIVRPFSSHLQQTVLGGCPGVSQHGSQLLGTQSFTFMGKPLDSAKGDPSVKGVMRRLSVGLNKVPQQSRIVALDGQPKDDVPPPPHFCINLYFRKEDREAFKEQYMVLGSPSVAASARVHLKNLGFGDDCVTFMCIRDKKVKFPGKSLYALGRSWFKEGFTKKDKALDVDCIISFPEGDKEKEKRNDDNKDALAAKKLLRDFVMQAKARARITKKKGKKVQKQVSFAPTPANEVQKEVRLGPPPANKVEKKVRFAPTPAPHRGKGIRKKRFVPKMRSMRDIMANTKRLPDA